MPPIALLTDFGHQDAYVGILHGVISSRAPDVKVIDLCHEVAPQAVRQAGYLLEGAVSFFPRGTIFVAVVDPGVGSDRPVLCARTAEACFLAPDNGLLTEVLESREVLELVSVESRALFADEVSQTFHGRDVFAPVAAHLALGTPLGDLGPPLLDYRRLEPLPRSETAEGARGVVRYVDRFGNLITNLRAKGLPRVASAQITSTEIRGPLRRSYVDVDRDELLLIEGSTGYVEVSVNLGSAARMLNARVGDTLELCFETEL